MNDKLNFSGWDAITRECEKLYPNQKNPKHYGTMISWELGGNDPLEGISVYDAGNYCHFVTYGLSELHEKISKNKDVSGYGMEFTFKLKKDNYENEESEITCICGILQSIARITFMQKERFNSYEYLYTGQTEWIDAKMKSNITGFITVPDNKLGSINTENGRVDFVQFIGVTNSELLALKEKKIDVRTLYERKINDYFKRSGLDYKYRKNDENIYSKLSIYGSLEQARKNAYRIHLSHEKDLPSNSESCTTVYKFFDVVDERVNELK